MQQHEMRIRPPGTSTGSRADPADRVSPAARRPAVPRVAALAAVGGLVLGALGGAAAGFFADADEETSPVTAREAKPSVAKQAFAAQGAAEDERGTATLTKNTDGDLTLRVDVSAPAALYGVRFKEKGGRASDPVHAGVNKGHGEIPTSWKVMGRYDYLDVVVTRDGRPRTTLRMRTEPLVDELLR